MLKTLSQNLVQILMTHSVQLSSVMSSLRESLLQSGESGLQPAGALQEARAYDISAQRFFGDKIQVSASNQGVNGALLATRAWQARAKLLAKSAHSACLEPYFLSIYTHI